MFIQYLGGDMLSSFEYENQRYEVTLGDTASMEYARSAGAAYQSALEMVF